jgi:hypothetical protein
MTDGLPISGVRFGHVNVIAEDWRSLAGFYTRPIGEIVTLVTATGGQVTWCYATDPESNMIELQAWS